MLVIDERRIRYLRMGIAKDIERESFMVQYDAHCRKMLSNCYILAWMMQETMEEYENLSRDFIRRCIEKNIRVDEEGMICFSAFVPKDMGEMNLMMHAEAVDYGENEYTLLAKGLKDGDKGTCSNYRDRGEAIFGTLKKMYSIWLCINVPLCMGNTISIYNIRKKCGIGHVPEKKVEDELSIVMIYLDVKGNKEKGFFNLLNTLFSPNLSYMHKKQILWNDYQIPMEKETEKELRLMSQLSQWVYDCGVKDVVVRLLKQNILSDIQILQVSKLSKEELNLIKEELLHIA